MKVRSKTTWLGVVGVLALILAAGALPLQGAGVEEKLLDVLQKEYKPVEKLLPPDVKTAPGFKEGVGPVIGNVQMVQGEVLVYHKGQSPRRMYSSRIIPSSMAIPWWPGSAPG